MQVQKYKKRLECQEEKKKEKDLSTGRNLSERASTYQLEFCHTVNNTAGPTKNVVMHVMHSLKKSESEEACVDSVITIIIKEQSKIARIVKPIITQPPSFFGNLGNIITQTRTHTQTHTQQ